jgi:hypothetical protein
MVRWWHGAVVAWCGGGMVRWWHGAVVAWCGGGMVRWWHGAAVTLVPRREWGPLWMPPLRFDGGIRYESLDQCVQPTQRVSRGQQDGTPPGDKVSRGSSLVRGACAGRREGEGGQDGVLGVGSTLPRGRARVVVARVVGFRDTRFGGVGRYFSPLVSGAAVRQGLGRQERLPLWPGVVLSTLSGRLILKIVGSYLCANLLFCHVTGCWSLRSLAVLVGGRSCPLGALGTCWRCRGDRAGG